MAGLLIKNVVATVGAVASLASGAIGSLDEHQFSCGGDYEFSATGWWCPLITYSQILCSLFTMWFSCLIKYLQRMDQGITPSSVKDIFHSF